LIGEAVKRVPAASYIQASEAALLHAKKKQAGSRDRRKSLRDETDRRGAPIQLKRYDEGA